MTVNLRTFEELLMTMTMAQKINKVGGWTPVMTGDKVEAMKHLGVANRAKSRGKQVTWASRRESYLSFAILSSLKKTVSQGQGNLRQ